MSIRPDERYPLTWPPGWPRTPDWKRGHSPFKGITPDRAMRELMDELQRLGARDVIVSSNLKLRQDGLPYANQPRHSDEGIAVYFRRKGKDMVLACDKYARREDNMRAITKTIDAIRGIERWGSSDLMERAFTGFAQLEHDAGRRWWDVLGVASDAPPGVVESHYLRRRSATHPDKGGDATPDALAFPTLAELVLRDAREFRKDYDDACAETDALQAQLAVMAERAGKAEGQVKALHALRADTARSQA